MASKISTGLDTKSIKTEKINKIKDLIPECLMACDKLLTRLNNI
jgi:hypothetical protein